MPFLLTLMFSIFHYFIELCFMDKTSRLYVIPEISHIVVFGLGTLIAIGLETATLFSLEKPCVDKLNFVQPIIHALFTAMQMHFLSLNSQVSKLNLFYLKYYIKLVIYVTY